MKLITPIYGNTLSKDRPQNEIRILHCRSKLLMQQIVIIDGAPQRRICGVKSKCRNNDACGLGFVFDI